MKGRKREKGGERKGIREDRENRSFTVLFQHRACELNPGLPHLGNEVADGSSLCLSVSFFVCFSAL